MSKSKGNVINPMDIVAKYGSDAMRMGIVASRSAGQNQAFSTPKVIAGRNFCNKLWNMARFVEGNINLEEAHSPHPQTTADHWVMRQLLNTAKTVGKAIKEIWYSLRNNCK